MKSLVSQFTRSLYVIPGGYFLVMFIRGLFKNKQLTSEWRTIQFRGIKMKLDLSKQMGSAIYWRGAHDWAPVFAMENLVTEGQTLVDIGANQGEYTLWAARKTGASGKVFSFEPLSTLFGQLEENVRINEGFEAFVFPIRMGLSDQPGRLKLYSNDPYNEGVNTLFPGPGKTAFLEEISLSTLDEEVGKLNIQKVDFIKIDVEGAELMVLKGAVETLKRFRPILFLELNETACQAAGYSSSDIFTLLEKFGYRFELIGLRGKTSPLDKTKLPEFCNIIAKT